MQNAAHFWLQPTKVDPPDVSDYLPSPEFPTEPHQWPPMLRRISAHLRENFKEHPAVRRWMEENPESREST